MRKKEFTKQDIRKYIKFENAFGKNPFGGMVYDETYSLLYKRYRRIYGYY